VSHRLGDEEHQRTLQTCNEPEFVALPPGQIVPVLTDRGLIMVLERSFYRVLHVHGQAIAEEGQGCPRNPDPCRGYGLMAPTRPGHSPVKGSLY